MRTYIAPVYLMPDHSEVPYCSCERMHSASECYPESDLAGIVIHISRDDILPKHGHDKGFDDNCDECLNDLPF